MTAKGHQDYQARRVREMLSGKKLPTIYEIVKALLEEYKGKSLKREVISNQVCTIIGMKMDESIGNAINKALQRLESENLIHHPTHGHWVWPMD